MSQTENARPVGGGSGVVFPKADTKRQRNTITAKGFQEKTCAACSRPIERLVRRGRQRRFCSNLCKQRSFRSALATDVKVADLKSPTGIFPKKSHFVTSEINGLATPSNRLFSVYRGGIQGPRRVIDAVVLRSRQWTEMLSASGVRSYVSRIAKPALVIKNIDSNTAANCAEEISL